MTRLESKRYGAAPIKRVEVDLTDKLVWHDRPNYDGKELRPFEGRPGSMDAFKLPSLVNGQRVYWRKQ